MPREHGGGMTRWKRGETEFEMSVLDDGRGSRCVRLPKPLDEEMGRPERVRFVMDARGSRGSRARITVSAA